MSARIVRLLTRDTTLPLEEAVREIGGRASVVRAWLLPLVLPGHPTGRRLILWGDVLDKLRAQPIEEHPPEPVRSGKRPRKAL